MAETADAGKSKSSKNNATTKKTERMKQNAPKSGTEGAEE